MNTTPSPLDAGHSGPAATRSRRRWPVVAGVAILLAAGGGGLVTWRAVQKRRAIVLPALPALPGWPAVFQQKLREAQNAAAASDRPVAAVILLARLYHANGFLTEAESCWRWVHAQQPHEAKWTYYLADANAGAGDYAQVRALLEETLRDAPGYSPAWLRLADLDFKTGRIDEAEKSYERRLGLVPADPYARLGIARIAQQREQRDRARQLIEQLLHDTPDFTSARNLYAQILETAGELEAAKQQRIRSAAGTRFREADDPWLEALRADCYDTKRLCVLATIDFQTHHGDRGRADIERALALAPTDRDVILLAGNQYLKLGEPAKARDIIQRGFEVLRPAPMMLYFERCEALRLLNQSDEALRVVRQGLAELPRAFELHNELGTILGDLGRLPESAAAYRAALAIAPDDTDSNYNLGITLLALGQRAEAIDAIKRSLRVEPTYPRALIMLGRLDLEAGQLERAGEYIHLVYDLHPEQQQAQQLMAAWHLREGMAAAARNDSAAAGEHYRTGYAIDSNNAELSVDLGIWYLLQNQPAEAIAPFESYRRLKPKDAQGALFLGQTYAQVGRLDDARRLLREGEQQALESGNRETAAHCREILGQLP